MPHVSIKLVPGKSEEQKVRLAEAIVHNVIDLLHSAAEAVSVTVEEIEPQDWTEQVYRPDILGKWKKLYKKPGYNPLQ